MLYLISFNLANSLRRKNCFTSISDMITRSQYVGNQIRVQTINDGEMAYVTFIYAQLELKRKQ